MIICVVALCLFFTANRVEANENGISFSVEALTNEGESNQQGFYQLEGKPSESEQLKIKINNLTDTKIIIDVAVNTAFTNQNGIPSYTKAEIPDDTLKYPIETILKLSDGTLVLEPEASQILDVTVDYPTEEWEGQLLGGIRFTEENDQQADTSIIHQVAYTIGVLLTMEEGVLPENSLTLNEVIASQRNYRSFIEANIQNTSPIIVSNMEVNAEIKNLDSSKTIYEYSAIDMRMAPNSNFNLGIPTGNVPLQAGQYKLLIHALADTKEYTWEKEFEISASQARELNQSAVNLESGNNQMLYLIISGLLFVLVLILSIVLVNKKRKNLK
ncbi:hypothetical protein BH739_01285 [Enterococcus casseliflavus]|nr:hypothetical protein BH739_01285 [Enterococcus casseliflavus]